MMNVLWGQEMLQGQESGPSFHVGRLPCTGLSR